MDTPTVSAATRADKDDEVVVAVPHSADAAELDSEHTGTNVTVRVSRQIRTGIVPAVGVIVK